jgi:hypothetical protein
MAVVVGAPQLRGEKTPSCRAGDNVDSPLPGTGVAPSFSLLPQALAATSADIVYIRSFIVFSGRETPRVREPKDAQQHVCHALPRDVDSERPINTFARGEWKQRGTRGAGQKDSPRVRCSGKEPFKLLWRQTQQSAREPESRRKKPTSP